MKFYFSGISGKSEWNMIQEAGVACLLVDLHDLKYVSNWNGPLALDSGAYRAYKRGETIDPAIFVQNVSHALRDRNFDFVAQPDVLGDPHATFENWQKVKAHKDELGLIPIWQWGAPTNHLHMYLDESEIVGIGGLVPLMRQNDETMLEEVIKLSLDNPSRFHIFGANWLRAIEELAPHVYSIDTSKWLDGARYTHIIHFRNGYLEQTPYRTMPMYARLGRKERCVISASNLQAFVDRQEKAQSQREWVGKKVAAILDEYPYLYPSVAKMKQHNDRIFPDRLQGVGEIVSYLTAHSYPSERTIITNGALDTLCFRNDWLIDTELLEIVDESIEDVSPSEPIGRTADVIGQNFVYQIYGNGWQVTTIGTQGFAFPIVFHANREGGYHTRVELDESQAGEWKDVLIKSISPVLNGGT